MRPQCDTADEAQTRKVLLVSFHFPPACGSGVQRAVSFCSGLRNFGWIPSVLTISASAHIDTSHDRDLDVPADVEVVRAWGLDTARSLAWRGRYSQLTALPDRWASWCIGALWWAATRFRHARPDVIVSTFPIASAHAIGYLLHRIFAIPWIADFRDPMAQDGFPAHPIVRRSFRAIERLAIRHASRLVFTAPSARAYYLERYPKCNPAKLQIIENGYDEQAFSEAACLPSNPSQEGEFRLLHSGLVYPWERDPSRFFEALASLRAETRLDRPRLRVLLRACGHEDYYSSMLQNFGIADIVDILPRLPYREALREMMDVDGLLLLQAANSNFQIPAKTYEYLRAGRPILAVVGRDGDTAKLLENIPAAHIAEITSEAEIREALLHLMEVAPHEAGRNPREVERYSRASGARRLAQMLNEVCRPPVDVSA